MDGHLLAFDLRPAGVVADEGDDRHVVASEGVELRKGVAGRAVAPEQPDLGLRPHLPTSNQWSLLALASMHTWVQQKHKRIPEGVPQECVFVFVFVR